MKARLVLPVLAILIATVPYWVARVAAAADESDELAALCAAYERSEAMIPMRDGVKLYTQIYRPKNSVGRTAILLNRTPYMSAKAAEETCPPGLRIYFGELWQDGYILARQSSRGRGKSEGVFVLADPLRPHADLKTTDEATDAWDTVEWLVKNVANNNGKVAQLGISYDAMLSLMAATDPHPDLVAVSPQATAADFWIGDDFLRNGAMRLNYSFEYSTRMELSKNQQPFPFDDADTFSWYLRLGPLKNANEKYLHGGSDFWNNLERHRNYDEFWRSRNLTQYMGRVHIPVLTTAGWWDAEDFYGSMETAKALGKNSDSGKFPLVIGPWTHGGWALPPGITGRSLAKLDFGSDTATFWRKEVQRPWLAHQLLGKPDPGLPPVLSFRTGTNQWKKYASWPPKPALGIESLYLTCDGSILFKRENDKPCRAGYISDPANPVPYLPRPIASLGGGKSPWPTWQAQDQRFSTQRPDALLFASAPLEQDMVLTGEAELTLHVTTTGTDGDFIVKLLDIYPGVDPEHPDMAGYQLMLNHIVLSGRYLESRTKPKALVPGRVYELKFRFMGNDHAFLAGHRIAVQLQSTLFPVIARNPQTFVENIFQAKEADFKAARIEVVFGGKGRNVLRLPREPSP